MRSLGRVLKKDEEDVVSFKIGKDDVITLTDPNKKITKYDIDESMILEWNSDKEIIKIRERYKK